MKIRNKLILNIGAVALAVLAAMGLLLGYMVGDKLEDNIVQELQTTMAATSNIVDAAADASVRNYLRGCAEKGMALCQMYENKVKAGQMTRQQAMAAVRAILVDPDFGKIGTTGYLAGVSTSGRLVMHPKSEGADVSSYDFMKKAMAMKNGYLEYMWKNPGEITERPKAGWLSYFEPWDLMIWASSYKEEFTSLIEVASIRDNLLSITIGKTGYPYVIDNKGVMVIHPKLEGKNVIGNLDADGKPIFKMMLDDPKGEGFMSYRWQNSPDEPVRDKYQLFKRLSAYGWTVAISSYREEFFGIFYTTVGILVIGIFAALAVLIAIIYFVTGKLTASIENVRVTLDGLARGDLTLSSEVRTKDELGLMSESCNQMSRELDENVRKIKTATESSRTLSADLASHSTEISATVNQMSANMASMKDGITQLHAELGRADGNLEVIRSSTDSFIRLIDTQGSSIEESSSAITEMLASIGNIERMTGEKKKIAERLGELAQKGEQNMEDTIRSIREIETYTDTILELINIINNVAGQTNLLAMNAAIEAAHAGEAGKGFSVVADEIRKLAETAASNSRDVSTSLKSITDKIRNASEQGEQTNATFREILEGIGEVSRGMLETMSGLQEMSSGSQQITHSIENLNTLAKEAEGSGARMSTGVGEIYTALKQVYTMIDSYLQSITETAEGSTEISNSMVQLAELSTRNHEAIDLLEQSVARFKTSDMA